ncbi:hypothetical protein GALL_368490 [mine drainage metagenome]|uniref:Fe2OG dioxygenase domain-containing protein n=1 Tax=mine drainage metagenome TaxID=410659 RepID=A0A1J5QD84_9ZZZZ
MSDLQTRLDEFARSLTESELHNYKTVLAFASGALLKASMADTQAALMLTMGQLAASRKRPESAKFGIAWQGLPGFLTDGVLEELREESRLGRPRAKRIEDHKVVPGGAAAQRLGQSADFLDLVKAQAGAAVSTERSSYLYYDEPGMGIDPHIDNPEFALNAILMLEHVHEAVPSALVFYEGTQSKRVHLAPGELILFFADSVIHARERMKEREFVAIVAFGFQPI